MLAFGHGVHMCLGKHVALMEARLTLDEVMRRLPEYEIDLARAERTRTEFVQGWVKLPATLRERLSGIARAALCCASACRASRRRRGGRP